MRAGRYVKALIDVKALVDEIRKDAGDRSAAGFCLLALEALKTP